MCCTIGMSTTHGLLVLTCAVLKPAGMLLSVTTAKLRQTDLCQSSLLVGMLLAMLLAC